MHIHSVLCCQIYFRNINFKNECCEGNPVDPVLLHDESQNSIYSQPDKPARTSLTEDARKIKTKRKKVLKKMEFPWTPVVFYFQIHLLLGRKREKCTLEFFFLEPAD